MTPTGSHFLSRLSCFFVFSKTDANTLKIPTRDAAVISLSPKTFVNLRVLSFYLRCGGTPNPNLRCNRDLKKTWNGPCFLLISYKCYKLLQIPPKTLPQNAKIPQISTCDAGLFWGVLWVPWKPLVFGFSSLMQNIPKVQPAGWGFWGFLTWGDAKVIKILTRSANFFP